MRGSVVSAASGFLASARGGFFVTVVAKELALEVHQVHPGVDVSDRASSQWGRVGTLY